MFRKDTTADSRMGEVGSSEADTALWNGERDAEVKAKNKLR